jgi:hypothetical protein
MLDLRSSVVLAVAIVVGSAAGCSGTPAARSDARIADAAADAPQGDVAEPGPAKDAADDDVSAGGLDGLSETGAEGGMDGAGAGFVHPGLLHTKADFDRMKSKVEAKASPWIEGWNMLTANSHASLSYNPRPQAEVHRNDGVNSDNSMVFANDVAAAYACALRWKVSGDKQYADKAVEILNAWSSTLTGFAQ